MPFSCILGLNTTFIEEIIVEDEDDEDRRIAVGTLALVLTLQSGCKRHSNLILGGDRTRDNITYRDQLELSHLYTNWLLEAPDLMFEDLFRMPKGVFLDLCQWLRNKTAASDSRHQSLELKVMVFLWIIAYNKP